MNDCEGASVENPRPAAASVRVAERQDSSAGAMSTEGFVSSTRNFATSRRVQKLLDITVNDNFRELILYMNDVVPEFVDSLQLQAMCPGTNGDEETAPCHSSQHRANDTSPMVACRAPAVEPSLAVGSASSAAVPSSAALRTALEGRVVDIHRYFLQEWSTLNEVFEEVSMLVAKLYQESEVLETTLSAHSAQAQDFAGLVTTLQAELALVQRREQEIKDFQGRYHFTDEEQQILEEGPVDATYLDVLSSVQATHSKCRQLLLSRESYQSAAAVMDSTYIAIIKGTEKVARHLKTVSAKSTWGTSPAGGEAPELTNFYLRCMDFLRAENKPQWASVVEEVARLRRASVLRQYFHLMTTGSSTTASRTYHSGGGDRDASITGGDSAGGGIRPLEAEIGNPVFFFSSLFAWLHQVIVDEDDFFSIFFTSLPSSPRQLSPDGKEEKTSSSSGVRSACPGFGETAEPLSGVGGEDLALSKSSVLNSIFEVLCKHIQSALEGVLERFLRTASSIQDTEGANICDEQSNPAGGEGLSGNIGHGRVGPSGPIGLTGGIARLLSAAAGRPLSLISGSSKAENRYQHVMNRSQLEALVATTVSSLTKGLQTTHALLQLFSYCSFSTFAALLGRDAALTRLIADDATLQLLRVYHTIAKNLLDHSLDSVSTIVARSSVLRRLASAEALESKLGGVTRCFVVDFLLEYSVGEDLDASSGLLCEEQSKARERSLATPTVGGSSFGGRPVSCNPYLRSGLSKHQAQAAELVRTLEAMVLPVPAEVVECLSVLRETMSEAHKHAEIMESVYVSSRGGSVRGAATVNGEGDADVDKYNLSYNEQFFAVIVQYLLSFPGVFSRQSILNTGIDEPCRLVIQLNVMTALHETLAPYADSSTSMGKLACYTLPLADAALERAQGLSKELTSSLSQCVVQHYFGRCAVDDCLVDDDDSSARTVVTGEGNDRGKDGNRDAVKGEEALPHEMGWRAIMEQLNSFYGAVAATGRVYVPIVASLISPSIRGQVTQGVRVAAVAAYKRRYKQLLTLLPLAGTGAAVSLTSTPMHTSVEDLHPEKLCILLDVDSQEVEWAGEAG